MLAPSTRIPTGSGTTKGPSVALTLTNKLTTLVTTVGAGAVRVSGMTVAGIVIRLSDGTSISGVRPSRPSGSPSKCATSAPGPSSTVAGCGPASTKGFTKAAMGDGPMIGPITCESNKGPTEAEDPPVLQPLQSQIPCRRATRRAVTSMPHR